MFEEILEIVKNCDDNNRQFNKTDIVNLSQEIINKQLLSSDIITILKEFNLLDKFLTYEKEIEDEKIGAKLELHGKRHIKNVLLYSTIVGYSVVKDSHDLELIMLAAKYHDVGRITEEREEHALASAKIALERLKDKYSKEDIAIIYTMIEFHEVPRSLPDIDRVFKDMAKKNGVLDEKIEKVRKMAEVLKDADALDRTRFISRARLNPNYLVYDLSKRLIRIASSIQETIALRDLYEYGCDNEIAVLLNNETPQELFRDIRINTEYSNRLEDIQRYIRNRAKVSFNFLNRIKKYYDDIKKKR